MITETTTQLITDLKDPANGNAWGQFDRRYRPVLRRFGQSLGFVADDAEELAQQTLSEFSRAIREGQYLRERGRLRSWLIGIARNVAHSMRRKRGNARGGADSVLDQIPDESQMSRIWEQEREQAIFAEALSLLRTTTQTDPATIEAFELYAIHGMPVREVAERCKMSVDSIYVAKNRLTKRLRELVEELTAAYTEGE